MRRWMLILCFIRSTSDFNLFWIVWWWSLTFVWKTDFSLNWIGIWSFCFKLCKITCNYNLCGFSVSPNCISLVFFKRILRGFRIQFTFTITQLISTKSTPEKLCRSCQFCVQKRYKKEQFRKASNSMILKHRNSLDLMFNSASDLCAVQGMAHLVMVTYWLGWLLLKALHINHHNIFS